MSTDDFIFWCGPSVDEEEDVGFEDEMPVEDEHDLMDKGKARESMYVTLVEGVVYRLGSRFHADHADPLTAMVRTVLENENFLFSDEELSFFTAYNTLSCMFQNL